MIMHAKLRSTINYVETPEKKPEKDPECPFLKNVHKHS